MASRSRDSVSHTVSSMVLVGARRSSPGMVEVRYDCVLPPGREEMLPVSGARSEMPWIGSSRSSSVAVGLVSRPQGDSGLQLTIVRVDQVPLHRVAVIGRVRHRGARHHSRHGDPLCADVLASLMRQLGR